MRELGSDATLRLAGTFNSNYRLMVPSTETNATKNAILGVYDFTHPIMYQVTSSNFISPSVPLRPIPTLNTVTTVASWADSVPMVVTSVGSSGPRRVDIGNQLLFNF